MGPCPGGPTAMGRILLTVGFIPRGRAQSPEAARPRTEASREDLASYLEKCEADLETAEAVPESAWFLHPLLGYMKRDQALRFMRVHNRHHVAIVKDIRRQAGA